LEIPDIKRLTPFDAISHFFIPSELLRGASRDSPGGCGRRKARLDRAGEQHQLARCPMIVAIEVPVVCVVLFLIQAVSSLNLFYSTVPKHHSLPSAANLGGLVQPTQIEAKPCAHTCQSGTMDQGNDPARQHQPVQQFSVLPDVCPTRS
jgi:hypothetical protein